VLWNTVGEIEDLGTLGGDSSTARAINDRGDIVGYAQVIRGGRGTPFLWTETEGMRAIVECEGSIGVGTGINNRREVVGTCDNASNQPQAFFWSQATGRVNFPLVRFTTSSATAINDRGEVTGTATRQVPPYEGVVFKWNPRTQRVVFLRALGDSFNVTTDINRFGWVVGTAVDTTGIRRAAAWLTPRQGFLIDSSLGTTSDAYALNDLGGIAGTVDIGTREFRAVLWEPPAAVARLLRKQGIGRCLRPQGS
jgi:probable HAF family extracellular repeat protein